MLDANLYFLFSYQQGQSDRELNPYWKNGGNGLPPPKLLSHHKGFLKPKIDDNDDYHYTSDRPSSHTKTSYGRQSWKKHDHRNDKINTKYNSEKHNLEERCKGFAERKEDRDKRHRKYDNEKEENRDKRYRDDSNERREEREKRYKEYDNERRDKYNNYKRESKNKHREPDNEKTYKTDEKKHKIENAESNKHLISNEKTNDSVDKPFTDSELNALAAKQIKAEMMGNTVSNIY